MKIGELESMLSKAKNDMEYLRGIVEDSVEVKCSISNQRIESIASAIDDLIKFIENCEL